MKTHVIQPGESLEAAKQAVLRGEVIAVPTETVYGLAADATNEQSVGRIYSLKRRPGVKPLSVLVSGMDDVQRLCREIPDSARALAARFWPGPLTMVMKKSAAVADIVTAGGDTVGVRCPDCGATLEIIRGSAPLAAPSANLSDKPSPVTIAEVLSYFDGQIPVAVDGGRCALGIESTVLDLTVSPPRIVRRGALTKRDIQTVIGKTPSGVTVMGITGGTGAGKTTALNTLADMGATVIDCDAVYHGLLDNADMLDEISGRFPGVVENGVLDRKALGAIVFADADALNDLNAITHKYVDREVVRIIRGLEATGENPVAAVDAIALIESGLDRRCDYVLAVTAPAEIRIRRIMARDGIDEDYATARIEAQKKDAYYKEHCDAVLSNDTNEELFIQQCREHFSHVLKDYA